MTIANTSAYPQFKNPDFAGSVATFALVVATAGLTATVWLSAAGIGAQPRGYMAALVDASPARVTLPRVEVVARRDAVASLGDSVNASAGCAVEQTANKPG
ncbi:MAG: hypothetical protein V4684_08490 [Pseudomonadota bacterium]